MKMPFNFVLPFIQRLGHAHHLQINSENCTTYHSDDKPSLVLLLLALYSLHALQLCRNLAKSGKNLLEPDLTGFVRNGRSGGRNAVHPYIV